MFKQTLLNYLLLGASTALMPGAIACPIGDGNNDFVGVKTTVPFVENGTSAHDFSVIEPTNMAVTDDGLVYVLDAEQGQIKITTVEGKALNFFGKTGSLPGQLLAPKGLTLDAEKTIFVADTGNHRIQRFDAEGRFIKAWGQYGYGEQDLISPTGIVADEQFLYVTDTGKNRVVVFNKNGQFIRAFGSFGAGAEQFNQPAGITTDGYGNLYIADSQNNQIKKYSRNGKFYAAWGVRGSLPGQLLTPFGLAMHKGVLYVAELGNHRIQLFKENGTYHAPYLSPYNSLNRTGENGAAPAINAADIRVHYPASFALSPSGRYSVVCEPLAITCSSYDGEKLLTHTGMEDSARWEKGATALHYNSAIAVNGDAMAVIDAENHTISVMAIHQNIPKPVAELGGFGSQAGLFKSPSGVAINSQNTVLAVSDAHNHRVQLFTLTRGPKGELTGAVFKMAYGSYGEQNAQFNEPGKLEFDANNNLHVLDRQNHRIQVLDANFVFKNSYPLMPENTVLPAAITEFTLAAKQHLVVDPYSHLIYNVNASGQTTLTLGERTIKGRTGQYQLDRFMYPYSVAAAADGSLYVSDQVGQHIKKFNAKGEWVKTWGEWGSGQSQFYKPKSLAINPSTQAIYVVDYGNYRGQIFNTNGDFLGVFGIGKNQHLTGAALVAKTVSAK